MLYYLLVFCCVILCCIVFCYLISFNGVFCYHYKVTNIKSDVKIISFFRKAQFSVREWEDDVTPVAQPNLNFFAPEYILTLSCDTASDLFSLGMLMYATVNKGKVLYDNNENVRTFKQNVSQVSNKLYSSLWVIYVAWWVVYQEGESGRGIWELLTFCFCISEGSSRTKSADSLVYHCLLFAWVTAGFSFKREPVPLRLVPCCWSSVLHLSMYYKLREWNVP